jgi:protease-4
MTSIVQAFFRGTWKSIRFVIFILGVLTLLLVSAALAWGIRSARTVPTLTDGTTLMVAPQGQISEAGGSSVTLSRLFQGSWPIQPTPSFFDLRRALAAAAADSRLTQVVLDFDGLSGLGWAQAAELARDVDTLKEHGKTVVAYGHDYGQTDYLVASHATKVVLDPDGSVQLAGLSSYQPYLKNLLDRFGVTVHLFRVGVYKSAAEPYVRADVSPEARTAATSWMNDIWSHVLDNVAAARGIEPSVLSAWTSRPDQVALSVNGDLATAALRAHLVDALMTPAELESFLVPTGRYDTRRHRLQAMDWDDYLTVVDAKEPPRGNALIAVVPVAGELVDSDASSDQVTGASVASILRKARFASNVKAVVLRVDSPGGSVTASETVRREVDLLRRAGKVVVVSMGDTAASGGYWLSSGADAIWASPTTITGSIGIFGLSTDITKAMANWGVQSDGVATSPGASAWQQDPTRPVDTISAALMQSVVDHGYQDFLAHVSQGRGLSLAAVDKVAQGRVWSGAQAKELGLVTNLGGLDDALEDARQLAKLSPSATTIRFVSPGSSRPSLKSLMGLSARASDHVAWAGFYAPLVSLWPKSLRAQAETLLRSSRPGTPIGQRVRADCMCSLVE